MEPCLIDDGELLRAYTKTHSDQAFTQLVQRHIHLVYSVGLRILKDPELAQDVSQEVFLRLARQALSIRNGKTLPAWLYAVARTQALNAMREAARRRRREQDVSDMTTMNEGDEAAWRTLSPLLEEGMGILDSKEQAAVVLRFFASKPLREVGLALDLSEEAARKRISRGLEKLRSFFMRRGVQISSPVLVSMLADNAVQAAPSSLAGLVSTASLAGASAVGASGFVSTSLTGVLMTKTTLAIIGAVAVAASFTPLLLKRSLPQPQSPEVSDGSVAPAERGNLAASPSAAQPSAQSSMSLLLRVASLPPLTADQIGAYVAQNKTNAESLLAAYRASTNVAWLSAAAARFPDNPDVQYAIVANRAFPDSQQQWVDAYRTAAPDNALAWYFSALENFKAGKQESALADLSEATTKPTFHSELDVTAQAVEELHISAGRANDEAKIAAFQTCAQFPELPHMRELARFMKRTNEQFKQQGDQASVDSIAGMGIVLGANLTEGTASQTLINQLVGIAVQKSFLQQLPPDATDPFGRPVGELSRTIESRTATIKEYAKMLSSIVGRLDDKEWTVYMDRVKLYGEESALAWLKSKHGD